MLAFLFNLRPVLY